MTGRINHKQKRKANRIQKLIRKFSEYFNFINWQKACTFNKTCKPLPIEIGTAGFELATSRTPSERATRLRYVPSTNFRLKTIEPFVKLEF